jgi:hypothetical protein
VLKDEGFGLVTASHFLDQDQSGDQKTAQGGPLPAEGGEPSKRYPRQEAFGELHVEPFLGRGTDGMSGRPGGARGSVK